MIQLRRPLEKPRITGRLSPTGQAIRSARAGLRRPVSFAELRDFADKLREELLRVPGVAKVDYFGEQTQVIHVEISNRKLATLGITPADIEAVLRAQNAVTAAGSYETASDHITLRESGQFHTVKSLEAVTFRADGRLLRLGDIAHIYRGYEDPPEQQMRFEGRPVLGIGVTMQAGGNVIQLSKHLQAAMTGLQQRLPAGLTLHTVTDGGVAVEYSVDDFQAAVGEAIAIVLVVSLLTPGLRTGMVARAIS